MNIKVLLMLALYLIYGLNSQCSTGTLRCDVTSDPPQPAICDFTNSFDLMSSGKCLKNDIEGCELPAFVAGDICFKCQPGKVLDSVKGLCVVVSEELFQQSCLEYDGLTSICTICKRDFHLLDGQCLAVSKRVANCKRYEGESTCGECESGFELRANQCHAFGVVHGCRVHRDLVCDKCNVGFQMALYRPTEVLVDNEYKRRMVAEGYDLALWASQGSVSFCESEAVDHCLEFNGGKKCAVCEDGYYLVESGVCMRNPLSPFVGCEKYSDKETCVKCAGEFYLFGNPIMCNAATHVPQCIKYAVFHDKCELCETNFHLNKDENKCVERVVQMFDECAGMSLFADECERCKDGMSLTTDKKSCLPDIQNCLKMYFAPDKTADGHICGDCGYRKAFVDGACVDGPDTNCMKYNVNECIECGLFHYVKNGGCAERKIQNCLEVMGLDLDGCVQCSLGFYQTGAGECIEQNQPNCYKHKPAANECVECEEGHWLDDVECKLQNIAHCYNYVTAELKCLSCSAGYYLHTNQCLKTDVDECAEYQFNTNVCTGCSKGHYLDSINNVCINQDVDHCIGYEEDVNQCKAAGCQKGRFLNGAVCQLQSQLFCIKYTYNTNTCIKCQAGYWLDDEECKRQTVPGCVDFIYNSNNCVKCALGYELSGNSSCTQIVRAQCVSYNDISLACLKCQAGYYLDGSGDCQKQSVVDCIEYTVTTNTCTKCAAGFLINTGSNTCNAYTGENCISWDTIDGECAECAAHYRLDNNTCILMQNDKCIVYNADGTCQKCQDGCYFDGSGDCQVSSKPNCAEYTPLTNDCVFCHPKFYEENKGCLPQLVDNCIVYEANKNECKTCESSYFLESATSCVEFNVSNCAELSTSGLCVACKPDDYLDGTVCKTRDKANCIKYVGNTNACGVCEIGKYVDNEACVAYSVANCVVYNIVTHQCSKCRAGYWMDGLECKSQNVIGCIEYTSGTGDCATCRAGQYLASAASCLPWDITGCAKFTANKNECEICSPHYNKNGTICDKFSLAGCIDYSSFNVCQTCALGHFKKADNSCFQQGIPNCITYADDKCTECQMGFWYDNTMNAGQGGCAAQDLAGCIMFTFNVNECTKCDWKSVLQGTTCTPQSVAACIKHDSGALTCNKCAAGYYPNSTSECLAQSQPNCIEYTADTNTCTECEDPFELSGSTCQRRSQNGCVKVAVDGKCLTCKVNYKLDNDSCSLASIGNCLQYTSDLTKCSTCKFPMFLNDEKTACVNSQSTSNCLTYSNKDGVCSKCSLKYEEKSSACQAKVYVDNCKTYNSVHDECTACHTYYYIDSDANQCKPHSDKNCKVGTSYRDTCTGCPDFYTSFSPAGCVKNTIDLCESIPTSNCVRCHFTHVVDTDNNVCIFNPDPKCLDWKEGDRNEKCVKCKTGYYVHETTEKCTLMMSGECEISGGVANTCLACTAGKTGEDCDTDKDPDGYGIDSHCLGNLMTNTDLKCTDCKSGYDAMNSVHFTATTSQLSGMKCTHLVNHTDGLCDMCLTDYERTTDGETVDCTLLEHTYWQACNQTWPKSAKTFSENRDCTSCTDSHYYFLKEDRCLARNEYHNMLGCTDFSTNSKHCAKCDVGLYLEETVGYEECVPAAEVLVPITDCLRYVDKVNCGICVLGKQPSADGSACEDIDPSEFAFTMKAYGLDFANYGPIIDSAQKIPNCEAYSQIYLNEAGCTKCQTNFVGIVPNPESLGVKKYAYSEGAYNAYGVDDVMTVFVKCLPVTDPYLMSSNPLDPSVPNSNCLVGVSMGNENLGGYACIRCKQDYLGLLGEVTHYPDGSLIPGDYRGAIVSCAQSKPSEIIKTYGGMFFNNFENKGRYLTPSNYFPFDSCSNGNVLVYMLITGMKPISVRFPKTLQSDGSPMKLAYCLESSRIPIQNGCQFYTLTRDFSQNPDFTGSDVFENVNCMMCKPRYQAVEGECVSMSSKCGYMDSSSKEFLGGCRSPSVTVVLDYSENLMFSYHVTTADAVDECKVININDLTQCYFYSETLEMWGSELKRSMTSENGCKWRIGKTPVIDQLWSNTEKQMRTFNSIIWRRYDTVDPDFSKEIPKADCMACGENFEMNWVSGGKVLGCGSRNPEPVLPSNCAYYDPRDISKCAECIAGFIINVNGLCQSITPFDFCNIANGDFSECDTCESEYIQITATPKICILKFCEYYDPADPFKCMICDAGYVTNGLDRRYCVINEDDADKCSQYSLELGFCIVCKESNFPVYRFKKETASDPRVAYPFDDAEECRDYNVDLTRYKNHTRVYFETTWTRSTNSVENQMLFVHKQSYHLVKYKLEFTEDNFKENHCVGGMTIPNCTTPNGGLCDKCNDTYFLKDDMICVETTITGCKTPRWTGSGDGQECDMCFDSHYLADAITCTVRTKSMKPNCFSQSKTTDVCLLCRIGYYQSGDLCLENTADFCVVRSREKNECDSCFYKYELDTSDPKVCVTSFVNTSFSFCKTLKPDNTGCLTCQADYYINGNNCSQTTVTNCMEIVPDKNECARCAPEKKVTSNKLGCEAKTATNCKTYHATDDSCLTCTKGYVLESSSCVAKTGPFCVSWGSGTDLTDKNKCNSCGSYHFKDSNGECAWKTASGCLTLSTSADSCATCNKNYTLQSGVCVKKPSTTCLLVKDTTTTSQASQCETCSDQFTLSSSLCALKSAANCDGMKTDADECVACSDDMIADGTSCTLKTSAYCSAFATGDTDECTGCGTNFLFTDSNKCEIKSLDNCLTWDPTTGKCATCNVAFELSGAGSCVENDALHCKTFKDDTLKCLDCEYQHALDSNEKNCVLKTAVDCGDFHATNDECLGLCGTNLYKSGTSCVARTVSDCNSFTDQEDKCTDCGPWFLKATGDTCVRRTISHCKTYVSTDDNYCGTCEDGFVKIGNECVTNTGNNCKTFVVDDHGCASCGAKYYMDGSDCVAKDTSNCLAYKPTSDNGCHTCNTEFWTQSGDVCTPKSKTDCKSRHATLDKCATCGRLMKLDGSGSCVPRTAQLCDLFTAHVSEDDCQTCTNGFFGNLNNCDRVDKTHCKTFKDSFNECETCSSQMFVLKDGACNRRTATSCHNFNTTKDECLNCTQPLKLSVDKLSCVDKTAEFCKTIHATEDKCDLCGDYFFPGTQHCERDLTAYCLNYDGTKSGCQTCSKEYPIDVSGLCIRNDKSHCDTFKDDTNECLTCEAEFFKNTNGECLPNTGQKCKTFKVNDDGCADCGDMHVLSGLHCVVNSAKYCKTFASDEHRCDTCWSTFIKDTADDLICKSNAALNCTNFQSVNQQCLSCSEGHYLSTGSACVKSTASGCKSFVSQQNRCELCMEGYVREGDNCVAQHVPHCSLYLEDVINSCEICDVLYHRVKVDNKYECHKNTNLECRKYLVNQDDCDECIVGYADLQHDKTVICKSHTAQNCGQYQLRNNACVVCLENAYQNSENGGYFTCETRKILDCAEFKLDADACSVCKSDKFMVSSGSCSIWTEVEHCLAYSKTENECIECNTGYFIDSEINQCEANPKGLVGCVAYDATQSCVKCDARHFLDNADLKCVLIVSKIEGCAEYSDQENCVKCEDNFNLFKNECHIPNINYCVEYASPFECNVCQSNYLMDPKTNRCDHSNIAHCMVAVKQSDLIFCEKCQSGFMLSEDQKVCEELSNKVENCIEYGTVNGLPLCFKCNDGFVLTKARKACLDIREFDLKHCARGFESVVNKCQQCHPGYELNEEFVCRVLKQKNCAVVGVAEGICQLCLPGTYMNESSNCVGTPDVVVENVSNGEGNGNSNGNGNGSGNGSGNGNEDNSTRKGVGRVLVSWIGVVLMMILWKHTA